MLLHVWHGLFGQVGPACSQLTARRMFTPLGRSAAALSGVAVTGLVISDRDQRDAVRGIANGASRFGRAFFYGSVVSMDFKYRYNK